MASSMRLSAARLHLAWLISLSMLVAVAPGSASAEIKEVAVGITGGALFPGFQPPKAIAPALVGWVAGVETLYGATDNLSLRGAFSVARFTGRLDGWTVPGSSYSGSYTFDAAYYHPEVGGRYKLYAGYNLAPYVEADVGFMWAVYSDGAVRRKESSTVAYMADEAHGHLTAGAGLALDYRIANTALVGIAVRYTRVFGGLSAGLLSVPLYLSYYW